eukprot:gene18159-19971_t
MAANDERVDGVPHFDFHITDRNLDQSARTLMSHIKKSWKIDKLQKKVFDDGISNKLYGYFVPYEFCKDSYANSSFTPSKEGRSEIVLMRIYGPKTELFIDRAKELRNFQLLRKHGLSPALFCTFENGFCYGFYEGSPLSPTDFQNPDFYEKVAKHMARLHAIQIDQSYLHHHKLESNLFEDIRGLIRMLPAKFSDPEKQVRYETKIPSSEILKQELQELEHVLSKSESPIVFSHNDALCGNFIFNQDKDELYLIDYEYASPNYGAYDIANHFNEFAGVADVDYSRFPDKELQLKWFRIYLQEIEERKWNFESDLTSERLEKLYIEVNKFSLASHLYWGVWAIMQAYSSEINFDFMEYAITRLNEYFRRKPEVLAL